MACWTGLQRTRILCGLPWKPSATSLSSDWFYATGHHRVTGERPEESSRGAEIGKFVTGYVLWLPAVRQPPDVDLSIDARRELTLTAFANPEQSWRKNSKRA